MLVLAKYGQAKTIPVTLYGLDGVSLSSSATFATGDVVRMQDEGAEANATNLLVDEGLGYSLTLTTAELTAARVKVYIVDQTDPKVWLDTDIMIETYGHVLAEHEYDLDTTNTPTAPTPADIRVEMDTNSVDLNTILSNQGVGDIKHDAILAGQGVADGKHDNILINQGIADTKHDTIIVDIGINLAAINTKPTAVQVRTEMDTNSVDLNTIIANQGTADGKHDTIITGVGDNLTAINTKPSAAQVRVEMDTNSVDLNTIISNQGTADTKHDAITAAVAALNALLTDARAQPGQGTPAATTDVLAKIDDIHKRLINKIDTDGSTERFWDSTGTVVDHKRSISELNQVVTKDVVITGP